MLVLPVVDAFRALMPVADGVVRDESAAPPHKFAPGRLYVWPRPMAPQRIEEADGRFAAELRIRAAYCLGSKGETRGPTKDRETSERLDQAVADIFTAVQANRTNPLWWDAYVETIGYNAVRTYEVRAHWLDVVIRLNAD